MKSRSNHKQTQQAEATNGTQQLVQQRAYELYLNRGQQPGHELEDWLRAECEIREQQEKHTLG